MDRIPTPEELDNYYNTYSYGGEKTISPITLKRYNQLLDKFEKFRKTGKLLDVGCGTGWFLIEAGKRGWEIYGTEFSKTAIKICRENGIQIKEGELKETDFEINSFDIITSFEVIEHINNPHKELDSISNLLREGGLFYCTTPNFNSISRRRLKAAFKYIGYPMHLSYFTKKTLNKAIREHNFKLYSFSSTGISFNVSSASPEKKKTSTSQDELRDEKMRTSTENKWHMMLLKNFVNTILTLTNTGMTLKGFYIKNSIRQK
ncbi:MAG: class I SAM-dependent methyltransferase [Bacteroidota bacterium]